MTTEIDQLVASIKAERVHPVEVFGEGRALEDLSFRKASTPARRPMPSVISALLGWVRPCRHFTIASSDLMMILRAEARRTRAADFFTVG